MKWRSILVLVCVVFGLFVSSFSDPKPVFAVGNFESVMTNSSRQLFTSRTGSLPGMSSLSQNEKAAVMTLFGQAQGVYDGVFADSSRPEDLDSILQIYYSALGGAINTLNTGKVSLSPAGQAVIDASISFFQSEQSSGAIVRSLYTGTVQDPTSRNAENSARVAATAEKKALETCSLWSGTGILACFTGLLDWFIRVTILQLAGFVLWLSSNLLGYVIDVGIIQFSQWAPQSLYALWQIVRQVISMFVVFSGLYIGFMYIIGQKAAFQRYFVWIVIFGIFVNFSYPVTRAAIDLSNIVSISIYSNTVGSTRGETIGAKLMTKLGLQKLVTSATATSEIADVSTSGNMLEKGGLFSTILAIGYILYAAYIFFIASAILIMRTLALSFIIVASPLLFVDSVIPKLGEQAQKLRSIFFQQLSVSIVFMIMLFLAVQMTSVFKNIGSSSGAGLTDTGIAQVFNILMMLVVLHIMLKVTKATAGAIGQMASEYVGKVGGFATGAAIGVATGGTGLIARSAIGGTAAKWANREGEKALRGEASAHDTWTGRQRLALATSLSKSSFDLKDSKLAQGLAGTMGGASMTKGLGFVGRVKSYDQAKESYDKETETRAGFLRGARRDEYLANRQDGIGAKLYGTDKTEEVAKKMFDQDADLRRKYASASDDVKETMRKDKRNASFENDFNKIDEYIKQKGLKEDRDFTYSEYENDKEMQKILRGQAYGYANKEESKTRDEQLDAVKKFFTSSTEAVAVLKETGTESQKNIIALAETYKNASPQEKASLLAERVNSGEISNSIAKAIISADNEEDREGKEVLMAMFNQQTKKEKPSLSKEEVDALQSMAADLSEFIKRGNQSPPAGENQTKTPGGGGPKQTPPASAEASKPPEKESASVVGGEKSKQTAHPSDQTPEPVKEKEVETI